MPRAFDPRPPVASHDPTRTDLYFDVSANYNIGEILFDAFEQMIEDIIKWIGDKLGIDLSGWIDGIHNVLAWWTELFGDFNIFSGQFSIVEMLERIIIGLVDFASKLLGTNISEALELTMLREAFTTFSDAWAALDWEHPLQTMMHDTWKLFVDLGFDLNAWMLLVLKNFTGLDFPKWGATEMIRAAWTKFFTGWHALDWGNPEAQPLHSAWMLFVDLGFDISEWFLTVVKNMTGMDLPNWFLLDELQDLWATFWAGWQAIEWGNPASEPLHTAWMLLVDLAFGMANRVLKIIKNITGIDMPSFFHLADLKALWSDFWDTWRAIEWGGGDGVWSALCAMVTLSQGMTGWSVSVLKNLTGIDLTDFVSAFVVPNLVALVMDWRAATKAIQWGESGALQEAIGAFFIFARGIGNWLLEVFQNLVGWEVDILHGMFDDFRHFVENIIKFFVGPTRFAENWEPILDNLFNLPAWMGGIPSKAQMDAADMITDLKAKTGGNLVIDGKFSNILVQRHGFNGGEAHLYTSEQRHSGLTAWKWTQLSNTKCGLIFAPTGNVTTYQVEPGSTYSLAAWVHPKASNSGSSPMRLGATWSDSAEIVSTTTSYVDLAATKGQWSEMATSVTVPEGVDTAQFWVIATEAASAGSVFYVDDHSLYETTGTQGVVDSIHQAVNGGTTTNHPIATIISNLRLSWSNFWDGLTGNTGSTDKLPADVKTAAAAVNSAASTAQTTASSAATTASSAASNASYAHTRIGNTNVALYGATDPQPKISTSALPSSLTLVGSGAVLIRQPSAGSFTPTKGTGVAFPRSFYQSASSTSDFSISSSGNMSITATNAGWYQVEIGFGINQSDRSYIFHCAPVLYLNGGIVKFGPYADYYGTLMKTKGTQASFTVYLNAYDYISPGVWTESTASGSVGDLIEAQNSFDTYFSIALLNRSLA